MTIEGNVHMARNNYLALIAILLWLVTVAVAGVMFVKGDVRPAQDARLSVQLSVDEREFVLAEMRMLLDGVRGVVAGLAQNDMLAVAAAARGVGMAAAADVSPALMLKLPLAFKQQGMAVHEGFDRMAAMVDDGAGAQRIQAELAQQLSSCVACHASYRLDALPE